MRTISPAISGQNRVVSTQKNVVSKDQSTGLAVVSKKPTAWELDPVCEAFPPYEHDQFQALKASISRNGLQEPIWPTPSPIQMIGYLIAPQLTSTKPRRVFVAFFYGDGLAALAETHPMTMLHKPFGLRLASGIRHSPETFNVSPVVIKGDDAPIRIAMVGQKPMFAMTIYEGSPPEVPVNTTQTTPGQADTQLLNVLNIKLSIPGLASLGLNMSMPGIV